MNLTLPHIIAVVGTHSQLSPSESPPFTCRYDSSLKRRTPLDNTPENRARKMCSKLSFVFLQQEEPAPPVQLHIYSHSPEANPAWRTAEMSSTDTDKETRPHRSLVEECTDFRDWDSVVTQVQVYVPGLLRYSVLTWCSWPETSSDEKHSKSYEFLMSH